MITTDQEREAAWDAVRALGYTTRGQTDEVIEAVFAARTTPPAPHSTEAELRARIAELNGHWAEQRDRIARLEAVCIEAEGALGALIAYDEGNMSDGVAMMLTYNHAVTESRAALASLRREIGGGA